MMASGAKGAVAAIAIASLLGGCAMFRNQRSQGAERCGRADALLGDAADLRADGYLGRSLEHVELAAALCPSLNAQRMLAETLADVGLTDDAIAAYELLAGSGSQADQEAAATAIEELERRPPPTRDATGADRERAVALYRDGVNPRLEQDYDASLLQLRRSYGLWPDALTIVQIGLTHDGAGRPVEARRANARALAIAEATTGAPAQPSVGGTTERSVSVAVSARTKRIVSLDSRGVVEVWDGITGQPRRSFYVALSTDVIAVSPDGSLVALGRTQDRAIDILNLRTGSVSTPTAAGVDVRVWDAIDGSEVGSLALHEGQLRALAFGDDGVHAAVASFAFDAVAISADGSRRAVARHDGPIALFTGPTGEPLELEPGEGIVGAMAFRGDDTALAVTTAARLVTYDASTGTELGRADACAGSVSAAYMGADSRVVCATNAGLSFYDTDTGEPVAVIRGRRSIVSAAFADDGAGIDLWIEADDGTVDRVRAPTGETTTASTPPTATMDASHPTRPVRATSDEAGVTVRNTETGDIIAQLEGGADRLLFSDDGKRLVQVGAKSVIVWSTDDWKRYEARQMDESEAIVWADVNRDATLAIIVRADGLATLWDVVDRNVLATLAGTYDGNWVVMAPSGQVEGAGGDDLAKNQLFWKVGDSQLPGFVGWQRNYRQDLLGSILDPVAARSFERKRAWYSEERLSPRIAIPVGVVGVGFEIYNVVQIVQGELANPWVGLVEVGFWGTLMWEAGHGCGGTGHWACTMLGVLSGVFATYGLYSFAMGIDAFESSDDAEAAAAPGRATTIGYGRTF